MTFKINAVEVTQNEDSPFVSFAQILFIQDESVRTTIYFFFQP